MNAKSLFQSKTAVFNFLLTIAAAIAYFYPPSKELITGNEPFILGAIGIIGLGLRRVTNGAWKLFPIVVACLCLLLPSCGTTWTVSMNPQGEIIIEAAKGSGPVRIPLGRSREIEPRK